MLNRSITYFYSLMKTKWFFLFMFTFAFSNISTSQTDIQNYKLPVESKGTKVTFDLSGNYYRYYTSTDNWYRNGNLQGSLNLSAWKNKDRFDYGVYGTGSGSLEYRENKYNDTMRTSLERYGNMHGELLGTADYYLKREKYYVSFSYDYFFQGNYLNQATPFVESDAGLSYTQNQYLWFSVGYGKILNASRVIHADNFETVLRKLKVINTPLTQTAKAKLTSLLDKRNNGDYLSKYKDDNDAMFFKDVEKVLNEDNVIDGKLGAEATM